MALVLPIDVANIINPNIDPAKVDLTPYIEVADTIVTEELGSRGLSASRLKQIELYLAAHFAIVTLERGGLQQQRIGFQGPEDTYKQIQNKSEGFLSTRYGQQAVALDTSGRLGAMSKSAIKAQFKVAHSPKSWDERCGTNDSTGFNEGDTI